MVVIVSNSKSFSYDILYADSCCTVKISLFSGKSDESFFVAYAIYIVWFGKMQPQMTSGPEVGDGPWQVSFFLT